MTIAQIYGNQLIRVPGQQSNLIVFGPKYSARLTGSARLLDVYPLIDEFNEELRTNLSVISYKLADDTLSSGLKLGKLLNFAVDAAIAYEKPGIPIGNNIIFSDGDMPRVVLSTEEYRGEKHVALVALGLISKNMVYILDGRTRTLKEILQTDGIRSFLAADPNRISEIHFRVPLLPVPDFPDSDGWYMPDAETGVPHGKEVEASLDARYLFRSGSPYAGLLSRLDCHDRRYVFADGWAFDGFDMAGVVAEVPEKDVKTIEALIRARTGR